MNRNSQNLTLTKSEKYFVNDLYQLIISSAADPVAMMERLSVTLREFIGAAEIVLFECRSNGEYDHRMISHIKAEERQLKCHLTLADHTHHEIYDITSFDVTDTGNVGEALAVLGFDNVSIIPISVKNNRLGCLHVFGSAKDDTSDQIIRLLASMRPLLGVVMENYLLFNNMDTLIQEQTEGLNAVNRELSNLIHTMPDLLVITDGRLNILKCYNYDKDRYYFTEMKEGMSFNRIISREQYYNKLKEMRSLEEDGTTEFAEEVVDDVKVNYLENRIRKTGDDYLHIIRNITASVAAEQKIAFMNQYDQLTGLYNRSMFYKLFDTFREQTDVIGVLLVDMNGLKLLNETLGFSEGDRYLKVLAQTCEKVRPIGAVLSRVGDDELAFVVPNADDRLLHDIALMLNEEVGQLNQDQLSRFPLSISTGHYIDDTGAMDSEYIFNMAEKNLNLDKLLHAESKKSAIVRTLTKALEARDFITEGHADRMEDLLETFGKKMDFSATALVSLRLFGKFHDIGKVGISDTILFKPGKLNDEEYAEMKKHSEIGYRIALTAAELHPVADFILKHHERYDGKGYPIGLAGEEIPIECRILSIVDAYDAMTNNRPYRKALPQEVAVEELIRHRGGQFDPELVDFFVEEVLNL